MPSNNPLILRASNLEDIADVVHGFGTRIGGVSPDPFDTLNLGVSVGDDPANVSANLERIASEAGVPPDRFVFMKQVHGTRIRAIHERDLARYREERPEVDCLITDRPEIFLCVLTADCVPVLFFDKERRVAAAMHAGWKGTAAGIVDAVLDELTQRFHCLPKDLSVALGPHIRSCCYRVGADVAWAFKDFRAERGVLAISQDGKAWNLDLAAAIRVRLKKRGVPPESIELVKHCTSCERDMFFSHRRDSGKTGRMVSYIGWV